MGRERDVDPDVARAELERWRMAECEAAEGLRQLRFLWVDDGGGKPQSMAAALGRPKGYRLLDMVGVLGREPAPKVREREVEPDVLEVLRRCDTEGFLLKLPPSQLDRKLYVRVNKVLEAEGGAWSRKLGGHWFDGKDAAAVLERLCGGSYQDAQKDLGFFETPPAIVAKLMEMAAVRGCSTALEPSAGHGAIAFELRAAGCRTVAVEWDAANVQELENRRGGDRREPWLEIVEADFLRCKPGEFAVDGFDRIVMNPPFANGQDAAHVLHAYGFLRPGGRLVSVMGAGALTREGYGYPEVRLLADVTGRTVILPKDAFKAAGTGVQTIAVEINRPGL